jgi:hypothetical protein
VGFQPRDTLFLAAPVAVAALAFCWGTRSYRKAMV